MSHRFSILPTHDSKARVGILGGSFNPPHAGHVYVSKQALKRLRLDAVLWLVSPQNPLKKEMRQSFNHRLAMAKKVASQHKKIIVSDLEQYLPTTYTSRTLARLKKMHPKAQFVWLMGGDNAAQVHKWHKWKAIFDNVFVAAFARSHMSYFVSNSKAHYIYKNFKVTDNGANLRLSKRKWVFFRIREKDISSTMIRKGAKDEYANVRATVK